MKIDIRQEVSEGQFQDYHIVVETLIKYGVECIRTEKDPILIRYPYGDGRFKERRLGSLPKWNWSGNAKGPKPPFGFLQLPLQGDIVVFTGGEKDVLAFDMFNIPAISMQSENATIPPELITDLKKRFKHVLICYDLDETGAKVSKKWEKIFGIPRIELPDDLNGKDIYDFHSQGRTKEELMELIDYSIKNHVDNKTFMTAKEVLDSNSTLEFIVEGILSKSNLCALIGGSDSGKSLFLLQFGISYILNKPFLGLTVVGNKKVLYFSFEDDCNSLKGRLRKMLSCLSPDSKNQIGENLLFEFDPEDIEQKIENHMEAHSDTGLIIIDPLTEILNGADINSSTSIRQQMQVLKKASTKYGVAVIFCHHITKTSEESGKLNKSNSLGSQAIEAKSRLMIEMKKRSSGIPSYTEIGIVKGNDVDEHYKSSSRTLKIQLNKDTLCFEKIEIESPNSLSKREIDWGLVFGENREMKAKEILKRLEAEYDLCEQHSRKLIEYQLSSFKVSHGIYRHPKIDKGSANGTAA
ncbi:AAA family ATPase [Algoriphagus formosus]|uniref:AAA family ATPase n=1 Tax=Algoriphagus formosus TaxID=2007308 RepID=UPI000C289E7C|nr:AAA family ATPase [Algoriphagus formosus]